MSFDIDFEWRPPAHFGVVPSIPNKECPMSKPIRFLCAATLLVGVGAAHAFTPSRGMWWNPNESGRGYELDRQGALMTLGIYAYDADGNAAWYLGAGNYDPINSAFQGDFDSFSGGQCFGCAYSSPIAAPFGTVSIQFSDAEHGVLSYPGGSVAIEHFMYGYASKQDRLLGYWSFSAAIASGDAYGPQTLGEFLAFDSHYSAGDGTVYVSGHDLADPSVTALGSYSDADDIFIVDVTLSDGTIHHYEMQGDDTVLTGLSSYGNSTPTPAVGTRIDYYVQELESGPASPASMFAQPGRLRQR
jgi:hypothetical protein